MLWCLSVQAQGMTVMRCSQLAVWHHRKVPAAATGTASSSVAAINTAAGDASGVASSAAAAAAAGGGGGSAANLSLLVVADSASTSTGRMSAVPAALVTNNVTNNSPVSFFKTLLGDIQGHSLYRAIQDGMQQQLAAWTCTNSSLGKCPNVGELLQGLTPQQLLPLLKGRRLQRATSFAASFR
jgi:hypothetical protein